LGLDSLYPLMEKERKRKKKRRRKKEKKEEEKKKKQKTCRHEKLERRAFRLILWESNFLGGSVLSLAAKSDHGDKPLLKLFVNKIQKFL